MRKLEQLDNEVPILKKTIDLYKEFYGYLKTFPRKDQYVLGKHCEDGILIFMELILYAAGLKKTKKLKILEEASSKLDTLKVLFRIAWEMQMLDNKKYLSLEGKLQEIGRMIGGWIRSFRKGHPN